MTEFEFQTAFIGIILALAVSDAVGAVGRVIRDRKVVAPYWVHLAWVVGTAFMALEFWWALWQDQGHWPDFGFFDFAAYLGPYLTVVLLASVLSGEPRASGHDSYETFYYANSRWIFALAGFAAALVLWRGFAGSDPLVLAAPRLVVVLVCTVLSVSRSRSVHAVSTGLVWAAVLVNVVIRF